MPSAQDIPQTNEKGTEVRSKIFKSSLEGANVQLELRTIVLGPPTNTWLEIFHS